MAPTGFLVASPASPLLPPKASLANFAADYAVRTAAEPAVCAPVSTEWGNVLWSAAEKVIGLPRIEKPGEQGGCGAHVERTLSDAFLPFNATVSAALGFTLAAVTEATRTNQVTNLVNWIEGDDGEDDPNAPPIQPWEWDRVGHDTVANFTKDAGAQTLTRVIEHTAKPRVQESAYAGAALSGLGRLGEVDL